MSLPPPVVAPDRVEDELVSRGFAVLDAAGLRRRVGAAQEALAAWRTTWNDLPADAYLRDGGRYRRRRHGSFVVDGQRVEKVAHRAHWQPVEYNALHGGIERWFEPIDPAVTDSVAWTCLLVGLGRLFSSVKPVSRWYVEAHPFRIDTTDGIGRPTPEGAHRDGVDFVAVILIDRVDVKGGETRVFEAAGPAGVRFTLVEPFSVLLLDDARVVHESTPIQPLAPGAHRDTLVLTYRSGGFQDAHAPRTEAS